MRRVQGRETFRRLARSPQRSTAGSVRVARLYAPADDPGVVAVAFAVSRRLGGAVSRNRVRRQLRAASRDLTAAGEVAPGTYLVSPTAATPGAVPPFAVLRRDLATAMGSLVTAARGPRAGSGR